jgi:hypothetical protein
MGSTGIIMVIGVGEIIRIIKIIGVTTNRVTIKMIKIMENIH